MVGVVIFVMVLVLLALLIVGPFVARQPLFWVFLVGVAWLLALALGALIQF